MKILSVGASVSHTLIGIEPDRLRRTSVRQFTLPGGTELICDLVDGILSQKTERKLTPLNTESLVTFAECLDFQIDPKEPKQELWRIDKIVGQTQTGLATSLKLNVGDCGDKLLLAE